MENFSEKDWKIFKRKIPEWQEAYMERLNNEYIELLNGEGWKKESGRIRRLVVLNVI